MNELFKILGTIAIDGSNVDSELNKAVGKAESSGGKFQSILQGIGLGIGNMMVQGAQKIASFAGDAMKSSDALSKYTSTMKFAGFKDVDINKSRNAFKKYADDTVYDLDTITNTGAQLAANGIKNFQSLTLSAGNLNAVAGGNADTFKSVAMVMTQTAGAGKLTTENWNQLADAIPGASGMIQKALKDNGAYTGNFRDAMADGQITAEEFNQAIEQLGNKPVAVEAAKSTATFEGAIGNLEATITNKLMKAFDRIGKSNITDAINGTGVAIGYMIDGLTEVIGVGAGFISWASGSSTSASMFRGALVGLGAATVLYMGYQKAMIAVDVTKIFLAAAKGSQTAAIALSLLSKESVLASAAQKALMVVETTGTATKVGLAAANASLTTAMAAGTTATVAGRTAALVSAAASGVATTAQWAWNAAVSANPIGLVIAGVALLGAGIAGLVKWLGSSKTNTEKLAEANDKLAKKSNEVKTALDNQKTAQEGVKKASLDLEQAEVNVTKAKEAQLQAIREHGAGSAEAKQASIDLKNAELSLEDAHKNVKKAKDDEKKASDELSKKQKEEKAAKDEAKAASDLLSPSERKLAEAKAKVKSASDEAKRAEEGAKAAADSLKGAEDNLKAAHDGVTEAAKKQKDSQDALSRAGLGLEQSQLNLKKAQDAEAEAIKKYGADSMEAKQATIDRKNAEFDLKDANDKVKQSQDEVTKSNKAHNDSQAEVKKATDKVTEAKNKSKEASETSRDKNNDLINAEKELASQTSGFVAPKIGQAWGDISKNISDKSNKSKNDANTAFNDVHKKSNTSFEGVKNSATSNMAAANKTSKDKIRDIGTTVGNFKPKLNKMDINSFNTAKNNANSKIDDIGKKVSGFNPKLKNPDTSGFENAKNAIRNVIDSIKGFFRDLHLDLPKIKIPHINISGGQAPFGIGGKGSLPSFNVDWFAKGGIMDGATVFGMNGNSLQVGGEAGREAILPLNEKVLGQIGKGIRDASGGTGESLVFNQYNYSPENIDARTASKYAKRDGKDMLRTFRIRS